jgi:uncharacterized protein
MDTNLAISTKKIAELCEQYGVVKLDVFGSAATTSNAANDYDFIVELKHDEFVSKARRWISFADGLEKILGKPVDLVSAASMKNSFFTKSVKATQKSIYDRSQP